MTANNSAIFKETRTFIYDYITHGSDYKRELINHLSYPDERYEHYTLQEMLDYCLTPIASYLGHTQLLKSSKLPYEDVHIFLQYFAKNEPYSLLNQMADGDFFLPHTE